MADVAISLANLTTYDGGIKEWVGQQISSLEGSLASVYLKKYYNSTSTGITASATVGSTSQIAVNNTTSGYTADVVLENTGTAALNSNKGSTNKSSLTLNGNNGVLSATGTSGTARLIVAGESASPMAALQITGGGPSISVNNNLTQVAYNANNIEAAQVRNIQVGTAAMEAGTTPLESGNIYIQYE